MDIKKNNKQTEVQT